MDLNLANLPLVKQRCLNSMKIFCLQGTFFPFYHNITKELAAYNAVKNTFCLQGKISSVSTILKCLVVTAQARKFVNVNVLVLPHLAHWSLCDCLAMTNSLVQISYDVYVCGHGIFRVKTFQQVGTVWLIPLQNNSLSDR